MISHAHQFVYVHIPKTAGTSVGQALGGYGELKRGLQDHRPIRELGPLVRRGYLGQFRYYPTVVHACARIVVNEVKNRASVRDRLSATEFDGYFKFAFVRNPWARAASWYRNVMRDRHHRVRLRVADNVAFPEFIARFASRGMLRPQTFWTHGLDGRLALDFVGQFERLEADLRHVMDRIGLNIGSIPETLSTPDRNSYRSLYDDATRTLVARCYADEIALYGYEF